MPVTDLLIEGSKLLVLGMGIVFTFLVMLVGAMKVMSAVALRLSPEEPTSNAPVSPNASSNSEDQNLVAVISAAITQFRNRQNG